MVVALVILVAAPSAVAVADGEAPPAISNLGVAGGRHHYTPLSGGGVAFYVPEAEQGGRDLNGDGDATDLVVHLWTPSQAKANNLGVPLSGTHESGWDMLVALESGGFAFAVPEGLHGQTDLNGDGDVLDSVVHRWHPTTGLENLGLAVETLTVCCYLDKYSLAALAGGDLAFLVPENDQGAKDRNGDGDDGDSVATVWDHATGELHNLGVAASEVVRLTDGGVALLAKESRQGKTDLNDDGDTGDEVAQVWRRASGVRNLGLAARGVFPFGDGHLAVRVSEAEHGAADRNGDGDTDDTVIAVWDPARPATTENLELAEANESANENVAALERGHFAFRVFEGDQDADLTGDGDRFDKVIHVWDPATSRTTNLQEAGRHPEAITGGALAFEGSTLQIWDPKSGQTVSTGFPNNGRAASMPDGRVAFGVAEFEVRRDLNGDGDQSDHWIPHIWDPSSRTVTSLGLVGEGVPLTAGGFAFGLHEPSQGFDVDGNGNGNEPGADFNGDGDGADSVLHVWDGSHTTNLQLAGNPVAALDGNRFTAVTFENEHGGDLNGDGDATDMVVHIVDGDTSPYAGGGPVVPRPPAGGGSTESPAPGPTGGSGGGTTPESDNRGMPEHSPVPAGLTPLGASPSSERSGYWMVERDGTVYPFGEAKAHGHAPLGAARAVDLEPTPSGNGYWVVDDQGHVFGFGDAHWLGNVARNHLVSGEKVTSLSATPTGAGYWMFSTSGRVVAFGDATHLGDVANLTLNGPVLDSIATPTGRGYYMVASDGGIFAFGDARFAGSMGGKPLNAPVQSLVPDRDGDGYWLVASDGGIFSFDAPFRGSLGAVKLNKPISGMVPYGDGYLMVGEDGGIFSFSDRPFAGSLGDRPPSHPIVSVAAL